MGFMPDMYASLVNIQMAFKIPSPQVWYLYGLSTSDQFDIDGAMNYFSFFF